MRTRLLLAACLLSLGAEAAPADAARGLPPTQVVRPILDKDPAVAAAMAGVDAATHEAAAIAASPYEWTPKVTGQQRRLDNGTRYNEWNVGVERGIRWLGKGAMDRRIGEFTLEAARARYGEALHETALEFMGRWLEWQGAEQLLLLAEKNLEAVRQGLDVVERRLRAGDASKLEQGLARAEHAEQARVATEARAAAATAWLRLSTRFPGVPRRAEPLPLPLPVEGELASWTERVLAESDEIKVAVALEQRSRARAERLRADRLPDPTVSVFTASEFGGAERFSGIGISIPLPGGARSSRASQVAAEATAAALDVELKRREVMERVSIAFSTAKSALEVLGIAREGAEAMAENARLAQRAYELGEGDLATLSLARRQAIAAAGNAAQAQVSALKAVYSLLIHAHLIWDLERD